METIVEYLSNKYKINADKILFWEFRVTNMNILDLRDALIGVGTFIDEDRVNQRYIVKIKAGIFHMNIAYIALELTGEILQVAIFADEGLINQHTREDAKNELIKAIEKYMS